MMRKAETIVRCIDKGTKMYFSKVQGGGNFRRKYEDAKNKGRLFRRPLRDRSHQVPL